MNQKIIDKLKVFLPALMVWSTACAQSQVVGKITDAQHEPLPFATVALLKANDSVPVKGDFSNEKGEFIFENIHAGSYFLKIMLLDFKDTVTGIFKVDSAVPYLQPDIIMKSNGVKLDEVAVTVQKKTFDFKNGNITVNIEGSPLAIGNTVYDVLSRMPGVTVDNSGISIQGRQGVSLYIDDRLQQISGMQLVNLLRSMSATLVEKIEIIKNPSAKYDAAGSAGIINIKTKKLKITGFSGSAGYTISKGYYITNLADLSLNYKWKKISVFSSFNFYQGRLKFENNMDKTIGNHSVSTVLNSASFSTEQGKYLTSNIGLDWYINKKNTAGIKLQVLPGYINRIREGNNAISESNLPYDNLVYKRTVPNAYNYANYNFNFEHLFDTLGTQLKFSTDVYGPYVDTYKSGYNYRFTDHNFKDVLDPQQNKGYNFINLSIISSKLDFEKKLSKTLSLETGIKSNYQNIESDYQFQAYNRQAATYVTDSAFSNNFSYREQIGAAYVSLKKEIKKINLQGGLRLENTSIHTLSRLSTYKYSRQYLKLFPSLTVNYTASENHNFSFSYNKRIYRPDYNSFNPYYVYNDLFSISRGNPYLQPQITHHVEITHTFKGKLSNSFSYYRMQNPIMGQTLQIDSSLVTIFQSGNLKSSNEMHYLVFFNADVTKQWALTLNLGAYYYDFKGVVDGGSLNARGYSYSAYINNQVILPQNFKVEVSGWFVGPWLWGGFYHIKSRGALNLAIKKTFLNDKLTLSLSVYDLFFTAVVKNEVNFQNQHFSIFESYDTRRLNLSVSYNFGKLNFKQREIKSDDDEKNRLKH